MDIKILLSNIAETTEAFDVSGLSLNTKTLTKGDLFIALQGEKSHGAEYIDSAIENGCIAVLIEGRDVDCGVPTIRIDNLKPHLSGLAQNFYTKAKDVDLIAVTGTNGKTSVSHYISQLLDFLEVNNGVIGTLGISKVEKKSINTTPDIFSIYSSLEEYSSQGIKLAIIEASSHALMQDRLEGLSFVQGIFTNLTQDHLDYHQTMGNYKEAKGKLFTNGFSKKAIINRDDENHQYFLDTASDKDSLTFGIDDLEFYKNSENGFICQLNNYVFELPLIGEFNLSNALAAYTSVKCLGYSDDQIIPFLAKLSPPPGRMQQLENSHIWIDYAHTPDALDNALASLRTHYPEFKIRVLFGCGGDRDKTKRQLMGKIASEDAESIILTNDNPRSESPEKIIEDILGGIKVENDVQVILDRKHAIETAVKTLGEDELLLIAGKGHETTQTIGDQIFQFSDIEVALDAFI
ncbi:MAG: UDP-N-acetylmuramoyl-L-alanyl-D-glutamate--2,6-diaminopimelate ligase [SAR86 cluster bacterium]|jgi:UDP-N-acetylmuramoyl-L-alanyl-D-glutamate--2,6-diaminopimelate ligase|nr:UDP-N-acetylmuramoyl-L-alanyl-D-glutamate--2,6-diaminopimelate ligase [Candidatus Pseudothioglobus aerophilus]MBT4244607.1 UDP-N-acetylmuramoyl-L-alanyl-D-glutamate--2,6-diaminopimelate ligase [Gammaproteobacteria bacterium]MDO7578282.1 UDP-N-acetylmuramoyl-L-alanyl-D-glutamate--2,6-diaminopimelate ligase [SAR86 cluster bacterium]MDP0560557.1 UDP-N-acetylmuramoyl-L-alanyl-D-glutamate--2,6-diaminopimelate ligase [Candidatus Thioglobus sp.]MBT4974751.1 UDP-N-acetylmuramoyl-L-alanyl-D-glutamate